MLRIAFVVVNFRCQLDWSQGAQIFGQTVFKVFP